jgi:hypothetical protein
MRFIIMINGEINSTMRECYENLVPIDDTPPDNANTSPMRPITNKQPPSPPQPLMQINTGIVPKKTSSSLSSHSTFSMTPAKLNFQSNPTPTPSPPKPTLFQASIPPSSDYAALQTSSSFTSPNNYYQDLGNWN